MDYYGLMKHFHHVACGLALALAATATLATLASKLKGLAQSRLLAAASAVAIVALLAHVPKVLGG